MEVVAGVITTFIFTGIRDFLPGVLMAEGVLEGAIAAPGILTGTQDLLPGVLMHCHGKDCTHGESS